MMRAKTLFLLSFVEASGQLAGETIAQRKTPVKPHNLELNIRRLPNVGCFQVTLTAVLHRLYNCP